MGFHQRRNFVAVPPPHRLRLRARRRLIAVGSTRLEKWFSWPAISGLQSPGAEAISRSLTHKIFENALTGPRTLRVVLVPGCLDLRQKFFHRGALVDDR